MKAGGKAAKNMGQAAAATGRSAGQAVLHPSQTLRGAGQAMKTAAIGSAAGYVAWEKLTTDKSVARIVGDTVIGESAGTTEDIQELKGKAGEAAEAVGGAAASISSSLNGVSNFIGQATGGGLGNMIGGFFSNLGRGNVSGPYRRRIPGLRAHRLARQDSRAVPGHDAHRQQCRACPHGSSGERTEKFRTGPFHRRGTGARRRHEKIGHQTNKKMKYTEEMILHSDSGYCMPFAEPDGRDVSLSLGYGEQNHPESGEKFFHHGIDFDVRRYLLSAVASGVVSGVGNDPTHGICQTIRYGQYEVTYGHLSNVFAQFGRQVKAGQTVAMSGDLLHVGVKFKGEEMDPLEFLAMLYGNIKAMQEAGGDSADGFYDGAPETDYERDREEIERLMFRFLPLYMDDLRLGRYTVPEHTEQSLRNIFTTGAMKAYFYERMPSMANPLGLGQKALPLVCKVQNLLIADFLNYLALRHEVYLSTMGGGNLKKNFVPKQ